MHVSVVRIMITDNVASMLFVLGYAFLEEQLASNKLLKFMWKLNKAGKRKQQAVVRGCVGEQSA